MDRWKSSTFEGPRWPCQPEEMRGDVEAARFCGCHSHGRAPRDDWHDAIGRLGADEEVQELQGVEPRLPARCRAPWRQGQDLGPAGHELPGQQEVYSQNTH